MNVPNIAIPADSLIRSLQLQEGIFQNALQDITDDQALQRPNDQTNHYNWLLGHVTTCRYQLANIVGLKLEDPLADLYFKAIGNFPYKPLSEIQAAWAKVSKPLFEQMENLSEEELAAQPEGIPASRLDLIVFYLYHEAYHLGQMGLLRKVLGLPALKSN